jgi:hypothetical protein
METAHATSVHEAKARARKVMAIVLLCPAGTTREANARCAAHLAAMPQADRDMIAAAAGCNRPSEKTWAAVVEAIRNRPVESEIRERLERMAGGGR